MSKTQREKVIVNFNEHPILEELGFKDLVKRFKSYQEEEAEKTKAVAKINVKRKIIGAEIQAAIEAVKADSVDLTSGEFTYRATLIKGEATTETDEDKLKMNLMRMGKLDAATIEKIFKVSQVDVPAKASYVLVTKQ